jgi:hypothetical protein
MCTILFFVLMLMPTWVFAQLPDMKSLPKLTVCVFDPLGANGKLFSTMKDYRTLASEWRVDLEPRPFNKFTATIEAIGAIAAVAMFTKQGTLSIEKASVAWPETKKALWELVPNSILIALTLAFYAIFLNAYLDEFSAPFIFPVMLLVVLIYERMSQENFSRKQMNIDHIGNRLEESWKDLKSGNDSIEKTLREATTETTGHIGVMGLLVVILVVIGMVLDPYGAVILVSTTIVTFIPLAIGYH